jgi:hypothetical protein
MTVEKHQNISKIRKFRFTNKRAMFIEGSGKTDQTVLMSNR